MSSSKYAGARTGTGEPQARAALRQRLLKPSNPRRVAIILEVAPHLDELTVDRALLAGGIESALDLVFAAADDPDEPGADLMDLL